MKKVSFRTWSEVKLLTGLIWGEARGEPWYGKVAVAQCVRTRVEHPGHWKWGNNWREVILAPWQFSCFNPKTESRRRIWETGQVMKDEMWRECELIAQGVYLGQINDFHDFKITHYFNPHIVKPEWAEDLKHVFTLGKHDFYTCF